MFWRRLAVLLLFSSMIQKNCEGKIPEYGDFNQIVEGDKSLFLNKTHEVLEAYKQAFLTIRFNKAQEAVSSLASAANEYIDQQAPWVLRKKNPERMAQVLYVLAETSRIIAILLQPFCPTASSKLLKQLAVPENERTFAHLTEEYALKPGTKLPKPEGIFPRLENTKDEAA